MALTLGEELRQLLGEVVPEGGGPDDTMFSDLDIANFLARGEGDLDRAAYEGWRVKSAQLSNLVDTTEGNSSKKFSQLLSNAERMVKIYQRSSSGPTEGRARVGRISRAGVEWD